MTATIFDDDKISARDASLKDDSYSLRRPRNLRTRCKLEDAGKGPKKAIKRTQSKCVGSVLYLSVLYLSVLYLSVHQSPQ